MSTATEPPVKSVPGADGKPVTAADLPEPNAKWVPLRKAQVVAAVRGGLLDLEEACERYALTVEEFLSWHQTLEREGMAGLSARRQEERRKAARRTVNEPGEIRSSTGSTMACLITDIGSGGARLKFEVPVKLPDMCALRCLRSGRSVWVRVVWQEDRVVGVCFDTAIPVPLMQDSLWGEWLLGEC